MEEDQSSHSLHLLCGVHPPLRAAQRKRQVPCQRLLPGVLVCHELVRHRNDDPQVQERIDPTSGQGILAYLLRCAGIQYRCNPREHPSGSEPPHLVHHLFRNRLSCHAGHV